MDIATTRRYLPWLVASALFMEQLDSTIVNTGIPSMAASLGVTPLSLKAVVTSYILSLAVCIPVSGWLAERFVNVPVGLVALWFARVHMPDYRGTTARPLDVPGLALFGSGAALLSWLLEIFGEHDLPLVQALGLLAVSIVLLAAYAWHAFHTP